MTLPQTQGRAESPKTAQLILAMWRTGADTYDIAQRLRITEAEAYRVTSSRARPSIRSLNIPYAGRANA